MPLVLTTNALVMCPHGGPGTTVPMTPIWTVNDGFVTGEGDTGALACPFLLCPCVGYTLKSMNLNATQIEGRQVILMTDFQQSFTGLPLTIQDFHTTYDNSTPAPLPSGQSAPPPSPAMADLLSPNGSVSQTASSFSTSTMVPPVVTVSFTMNSDHPLQWILTLITATGLNFDLTSGSGYPGIAVTPSGGSWTSPTLLVTITILASALETFGAGMSYLYFTGVSQRGLNGHVVATIVVGP